jgi:hypothetical protein
MRWPTWLPRPKRRSRAGDLVAAEAVQAAERAAARQRLIDQARCDQWPGWNAPTAMHRPLLIPGRAARSHGGRRP